MADAVSKATIFFQSSGGTVPTGWTETFWSQADFQSLLTTIVNTYIPARKQLLGVGAVIKYVRGVKVQTPAARVSSIKYLFGNQGVGSIYTSSPADDYDPTQVDLLVRAETAAGKRRQFWIGGIPDSQTDSLKAQGINAPYVTGGTWTQFVTALQACGFCIRFITAHGTPNTYDSDFITKLTPVMVRKRNRGRPFNLFRGRRLA
jgi:hypothetical protein